MININTGSNLRVVHYIALVSLGLIVTIGVSSLQKTPGYMDADYYYSGGLRLINGFGFSEEIIWNYLDDPDGLPHPSHGYWMPLVSILATGGMVLTGKASFNSAQVLFDVIAISIPVVTALLAYKINARRDLAVISGVFAVFCPFYASYITTTDSFGIYMLCGGLFFIIMTQMQNISRSGWYFAYAFALGFLAGLMHLTRADGLIWLLVALVTVGWIYPKQRVGWFLSTLGTCFGGYLMVMGLWMYRNLRAFGSLFAPGSSKALWFTEYDDLFTYPASQISLAYFRDHSLINILQDRLWAFGLNLQTMVAVQGGIILTPLIILALWRLRNDRRVRVGIFAWLITFGLMTVVFPFAGARGGFFHSGAAIQPLWWSLAPLGLESFISWGTRVRNWRPGEARKVFRFGLIGLLAILSIFLVFSRIIGSDISDFTWEQNYRRYQNLEKTLLELGADLNDRVFVNNAPGYYIASNRSALSIPNGDLRTLLQVADRYQVRYLLLEFNQLKGDDDLYSNPGDRSRIKYLDSLEDIRIYELHIH